MTTGVLVWYTMSRMGGKGDTKAIPFRLDRGNRENLPVQLADGFRRAILTGYYRPGERLPNYAEIAATLGVSIRAPRDAMKILVKENLVRSRTRVGCEVMPRGGRNWKGRILGVVHAEFEASYYQAKLMGALRRRLVREGYSFLPVSVDESPDGGPDFSQFDVLLGERADFVFALYPSDAVATHIARAGVRALACVDVQKAPGLAKIGDRRVKSFEGFARRLVEEGVRSVLLVNYADWTGLGNQLRRRGIKVERMTVPEVRGTGYLETIKRMAMDMILRRFAPGRRIPDLICFCDDFVAFGGLLALAHRGIRVPGETCVVTLSNRGFAPVWPTSVARFEVDPEADGLFLAERIIDRLEGRRGGGTLPEARFVDGETFDFRRKRSKAKG